MKTILFGFMIVVATQSASASQRFFCDGLDLHSTALVAVPIRTFEYGWQCTDALASEKSEFLCSKTSLHGTGVIGPIKNYNFEWQCEDSLKTALNGYLCDGGSLLSSGSKKPIRSYTYEWQCMDFLSKLNP